MITEIPVEQVRAGDTLVLNRIGARKVVTVEIYDTVGVEPCECFIVVYDTGQMSRGVDGEGGGRPILSGLARRLRGELVRVERLEAA